MSQLDGSLKLLDTYAVLRTIDTSLYRIDEDEAMILKECTGIWDHKDLKQHILQVQAEAFAVFPYPCIRRFAFIELVQLKLAITQKRGLSGYFGVGKNTRERDLVRHRLRVYIAPYYPYFPGQTFPFSVGNDARRAIHDGFPLRDVICSDLRKGFFDLGHKLYRTTPETFPLAFFEGDIFQTESTTNVNFESTTDVVDPLANASIPDLHTLKNLGQLRNKISVINASAFFHLFEQDKQRELAHILSNLLSLQPGSIILGSQGGTPSSFQVLPLHTTKVIALHSPETWKELWTGTGGPFKPDDVKVHAYAEPFSLEKLGISSIDNPDGARGYWLYWSIKRL